MRTAGIIGGIGPESTVVYYRGIIKEYQRRTASSSAPFFIINSIDLQRMRELLEARQHDEIATYLAEELMKLQRAGVSFGAVAAVTPHLVFNRLREAVSLPLLSIVDVTCAAAKARNLQRLALFGARYTVQASFFPEAAAAAGLRIVLPSPEDQKYIHSIYFDELVKGIVRDETRDRLLSIVTRMKAEGNIDAVILGGTELSLILSLPPYDGVTFLDTTQLHVEAIVDKLLA
jgi:aspartate racemase